MKIFLDTADVATVKRLFPTGLIDGVTTNPTLIRKSGDDPWNVYAELEGIGVKGHQHGSLRHCWRNV